MAEADHGVSVVVEVADMFFKAGGGGVDPVVGVTGLRVVRDAVVHEDGDTQSLPARKELHQGVEEVKSEKAVKAKCHEAC